MLGACTLSHITLLEWTQHIIFYNSPLSTVIPPLNTIIILPLTHYYQIPSKRSKPTSFSKLTLKFLLDASRPNPVDDNKRRRERRLPAGAVGVRPGASDVRVPGRRPRARVRAALQAQAARAAVARAAAGR